MFNFCTEQHETVILLYLVFQSYYKRKKIASIHCIVFNVYCTPIFSESLKTNIKSINKRQYILVHRYIVF